MDEDLSLPDMRYLWSVKNWNYSNDAEEFNPNEFLVYTTDRKLDIVENKLPTTSILSNTNYNNSIRKALKILLRFEYSNEMSSFL